MRSGRKFSTKPMSAMPGRLMSATVISACEASESDNSSSCNSSRWSSNSLATPIDLTLGSVLVIRDRVLVGRGKRLGGAVHPAAAPRRADAFLLVATHAVLEPVGRQLDRGACVRVALGDHDIVLVRAQRDLRRVQLAFLRHDHADLLDAAVVLAELLEPVLRERA